MAKCNRCGRKGLFLKISNGLCSNCSATVQMEQEQAEIRSSIYALNQELADKQTLFRKFKSSAIEELKQEESGLFSRIANLKNQQVQEQEILAGLTRDREKSEKSIAGATTKVQKSRELIKAIKHACDEFDSSERSSNIDAILSSVEDYLKPTVSLELQCLDMRDLRKRFKENEKNIQATFQKYEGRYTTKANMAIYRLMVIALSAELQNILHDLGFGKLDDALASVASVTNKYYAIATDGNQSIAPTLKKFIGELDYYFQEAVRIEYEYYVQRERAREEQRAIREQMRQEAEERKELERQQKQIEKEESKFHGQIDGLTEQLTATEDEAMRLKLQARIEELQTQLANVAAQKERIVQLQNGKAGNVYIISNIGSFGEDVFKIGMTRRTEPMDRINELGNASVPFPFDVHSLIFSDDAVALETKLHHILNDRRVNKVNLRKEFFHVSLDELEKLVEEVSPTASFKRTALAEQYRQSLSIVHVSEYTGDTDFNDDEEIDA